LYTEQNIRGLATNFLRQHYKLRPRMSTSGTRVITKVHYYQGVTIDARLSYQKQDGSWFMATVEATSFDRAHEVLYRVNYFRIVVHAFLAALVATVLFLAGTQVQGESIYAWFGRPDVYLFLASGFITLWALTGAMLRKLQYYRYIYAIAQFMRFYADAQWIAYDRAIFFSSLNDEDQGRKARRHYKKMRKYYNDLQRQCIRFGFGLMEIRENNEVRWLIEPSHIDQFGGERGQLPKWMQRIQAPPAMANLTKGLSFGKSKDPNGPTIKDLLEADVAGDGDYQDPLAAGTSYLPRKVREVDYAETVIPAKKGRTSVFQRPKRLIKSLRWKVRRAYQSLYPKEIKNRPGYYELPWWTVGGCLVAMMCLSGLMYQHSHWDTVAYNGDAEASTSLNPLEPAASPARSDARPGVLAGEYDPNLNAREFAEANDRTNPTDVVDSEVGTRLGVTIYERTASQKTSVHYDCLPLFLAEGTLFLLQEGQYPDYATAVERAEKINDTYEVAVGVAASSCLTPKAEDYFLYVGGVQATEASANLNLRRLQREMKVGLTIIEVK
jgi:hypothetical protein